MDHRGQGQHHRAPAGGPALPREHRSKKNAAPLLSAWEELWSECGQEAARSKSCRQRLREHLLAHLVCPGRHTVSGLITVFGRQFEDWTSHYALYAKDRVDEEAIFSRCRREAEALARPGAPLCVALDDTILRKRGKRIPGAAFRRDPTGPPFHLNLVWAQRVLSLGAAVADAKGHVRMVPIGFRDASTPRKPRRTAPPEEFHAYKEAMKQRNLNAQAIRALSELQSQRAGENGGGAPGLHVVVDGSYTNREMLRNLPENTALIGRIRKDAHLNAKPGKRQSRGRKRFYGARLPTPEEIRKDPGIPWKKIRAMANSKLRSFEVKTLAPVRWRSAGEKDLRLVVVRPVGFRKRTGARKSYTQPAYLICTDPEIPLGELLQQYVWRWDIEVNHRDEKTILGVGQAQVRNENSVESVPATAVAACSMLHLAAIKAYGKGGKPTAIPEAKWRNPTKKIRPSTQDLINELRRELWASAIRPENLTDFMTAPPQDTNPDKSHPNLYSTLLAATA